MPVVVAWIAEVLVSWGIEAALAEVIGTLIVEIAISVAVAAVSRSLQPKPRGMDQGQELQTKLDPAYPREVGVGIFATGGSLVFENVSGQNNKYLWRVIAFSDALINQVLYVRGRGEELEFDGDIHTGLRECTSLFQKAGGGGGLWMRIYKGTQTQTACPELTAAFPGVITSNFVGRGVAYAVVRMEYDSEAWQGGIDLVFVGEGAECYDPRTDTTAFTKNAVLITRQYVVGFENNGVRVVGLGCDEAEDLDDAGISAAADDCDDEIETLDTPVPRYRAGGMISARETPRSVIANLTAAYAGAHIDMGGQITLIAGVARTPVMDISESQLLADEGIVFAGRRTSDERVNAITSTFVNPADGFQEAPLPPRKNAAAITADGMRYETNRAYRMVYNKNQGQRLDEIELRRARCEGTLMFVAPLLAFRMAPGDWFTCTNKRWGNVEKTWEVQSLELAIVTRQDGPRARCIVQATEIAASVFDWAPEDEIVVSTTPITRPGALPALVDENDRIITADGLPLPTLSGTAITRTVASPLSSSSSTQIDVAAHDVEYPGPVTYSLPSAALTGLTADTNYWVFYDIANDDYDIHAESAAATIRAKKVNPTDYILVGQQRTQLGGGGYSPPPPPPPGGGGGWSGGGGGGGDPP